MRPETPRINMPETASIGDTILIRTKIRHVMETGWRKTQAGETVPRDRLTRFTCSFEGKEVISADFGPGVAQDPYFAFYAKVPSAGSFTFRWEGDHDQVLTRTVPIRITENT